MHSRKLYALSLVLLLLLSSVMPTRAVGDERYVGQGLREEEDSQELARYLRNHRTDRPSLPSVQRPSASATARYVDESASTYIGREFTPEQFKAWLRVQYLGSQPYNAIGVHHTYSPTAATWYGTSTLGHIFDWYRDEKDWPAGVGPHIWLYDGGNPRYKPGQQLIYVATHPRHDGIGISYRNRRYVHIEAIGNFDAARMSGEMEDLYRFVLQTLSDRRGGRVHAATANAGRGIDNPSVWQGYLFHRDAATDRKPCPGATTAYAWFDPSMRRRLSSLRFGERAVVTGVDLNLRASPDWSGAKKGVVPRGTVVTLRWMTTDTQWRRVRVLDTGQTGFLYAAYLRKQ